MKILVVHNHYRLRGGEDSVFEAECRMLEDAGHEVVRYEKSNLDLPGGAWGKLRAALGTVWSRRSYREVREILRRERPDVMHCHNTFPQISPSVYYAAAAEGVPVVQTLHNYRLACLNGYLFRDGRVCERCLGHAPLSGLCRRCYRDSFTASAAVAAMLLVHRALGTWRRKVARYIALTDFAKAKFVKAGIPETIIAVKPNALMPDGHGAEKPEKPAYALLAESSAMPMTFLFLGRLSPEKGVEVLIDAWRILSKRIPKARLLVVGEGPERAALEARSEGLPGVRFLGAVPRANIPAILHATSALAFPSLWYEQFAMAPMEAMAAGVPVLVSDVASQGTLVRDGETGFCVPAGDADALAEALARLLADPALARRLGANARAVLDSSACPPAANVRALESIYRDAITSHFGHERTRT